MADAGTALAETWDRMVALAERIEPCDWSRPTPCPDLDVHALVAHVATATADPGRAGTPERLLDGLRATRASQLSRSAAWAGPNPDKPGPGPASETRRQRMLGASCLDMWVHAYDLATALDEPLDLDADSPALQESCRYLLGLSPQLFALRTGADEGAGLRVTLRGRLTQRTALEVRDGRGVESSDRDAAGQAVTATPAAFVLLLSGRGDPQHWRDLGALEWSGSHGEAFVNRARLFA